MAERRQSGKLAVILHADVAGSTELVHQDEQLAHGRIQNTFRRFGDIISQYHGRVRELRGDALLAEFERASDAVSAALAFQADHEDYLAELNDPVQPRVRVGIAMGEVVIADNTITGAGVVLAQRLEQLAEPGDVVIQAAAQETIPNRFRFEYMDLGGHEVKGFDKPVQACSVSIGKDVAVPLPERADHRWRNAMVVFTSVVIIAAGVGLMWFKPWEVQEEPASVEHMAFPLPDKPSIAVLPLDNYSDNPDLEFIARGMTEDLTTSLSKVPGLFVIARNSAATYKDKPVAIKQVAEELGVQYVLEGSVQKAGEELRINTQLIDALSGHHLWADHFDRPVSDVFAVQDEITKRVIVELQVELTEGDRVKLASRGTDSLQAWLLRTRGRAELMKWTRESMVRARELYEAAHREDLEWATPLAGIAYTHWYEAKLGWSKSRDEAIQLGKELAERAIQTEPDNPNGYQALGNIYFLLGQPERAIELRQKAIELAPNDFSTLAGFAIRLNEFGREQEAVTLFERAMRLSPKHSWWVPAGYGLSLHLVGRKEEALEAYKHALTLGSEDPHLLARLAAVYVDVGQKGEANAIAEKAMHIEPEFTVSNYLQSYPIADPEQSRWYKGLMLQSGLPEHPPLKLPDKPSIAVLPFTNMSDDPQQEYFVDGMTEDLITDLSKISGLFVIARNSSFTYKGITVDVKNAARDLGVRYVLEGSVRRVGSQVRINAQLTDATTGGHLWAERYDGSLENVFDLQDQVTQHIVKALAVNLTEEEEAQRASQGTDNAEAHDAYLQGWAHYKLQSPTSFTKAIPYFENAIQLDPEYTQAYAALASLYWDAYQNDWAFDLGMPSTRAESRAIEHLEEALKAPTPLAYALNARVLASWDAYQDAVSEAKKGIELDPNDAAGYEGLANALILVGRPVEAIDYIHQAMRLDPHYPPSYLITLGRAQFEMERFDDAATTFNRAIKRNINNDLPWIYLAATYGHMGRIKDGDRAIEEANTLRNQAGMIDVSIRSLPYHRESDFHRFGGQSEQERVRAGLSVLPSLSWTALVTGLGSASYISHAHRSPAYDVEGVTKIDVPKAKSLHDRGVVFIDVRTEKFWKESRIPGAVNLPESWPTDPAKPKLRESTLMAIVGKTDEVVFYCDSADCFSSAFASAKAFAWGFQNVLYFAEGLSGWKEVGYPVEQGK